MADKFHWNLAALAILPISAVFAPNKIAQIDAIYDVADDPATDRVRATALAAFAAKLLKKL